MDSLIPPEKIETMADLRVQIDALDTQLVSLLAVRRGYIDRAIDLKPGEGIPARATDRVNEVLDNVAGTAERLGLDPELARTIWTELIEWSIRREAKVLKD